MAREKVEGRIGNDDVVLNNAASEATLEQLLEQMQKMAKAQGLSDKASKERQKTTNDLNKAQKDQVKSYESLQEEIDNSTNALQDFRSGLGGLAGAFGSLVKGVGSLVSGAYSLTESFMLGGDRISDFFGGLPVFGTVSKALEENINTYRSISTVGASFGNSLQDMRLSAARARISLEGFQSLVSNNAETLAIFGSNVSSGAREFSQFAGDFRESAVGERFLGMGYTIESLNDRLAGYLELEARRGRLENMSRDQLIAGSENYLETIEELSKITGMQRDEAEQNILAQQQDARLRRMEANLSGEELQNFRGSVAMFDKLTPGLSTAMKDLIDGVPQTDEAIGLIQALGPESDNFIRVMQRMGRGEFSPEEARNQLARFGPAIERTLRSLDPSTIQAISQAIPDFGNALNLGVEIQRLNNDAQEGITQDEIDRRRRITSALGNFEQTVAGVRSRLLEQFVESDIFKRIQRNFGNLAEALTGERVRSFLNFAILPALETFDNVLENFISDIKDRGLGPAIKTAIADIVQNIRAYLFGGELQTTRTVPLAGKDEFLEIDINDREVQKGLISKFTEGLSNWYDTSGLQDVFRKMADDMVGALRDKLFGETFDYAETQELIAKRLVRDRQKSMLGVAEQTGGEVAILENGAVVNPKYADATGQDYETMNLSPEDLNRIRNTVTLMEQEVTRMENRQKGAFPGFNNGTLGVKGNLLQDFGSGTPVMLHGREAVLTETQLANLSEGALNVGARNTVSTLNQRLSKIEDSKSTRMIAEAIMELKEVTSATQKTSTSANSQTNLEGKLDQLNSTMNEVAAILHNTHDVSKRQLNTTKSMTGNMLQGAPV